MWMTTESHPSDNTSPFKRKIRIVRALHQQTSPDPPAAWNHNEDFFRFTAGRFLWNEREKLARRYVKFDVDQLARIAANASGDGSQPRKCVNVEKLKDGMNSKIFLLTMDNGAEVVAKIPYPSAGRPYYTTASEVATMSFVSEDIAWL